MKVFYRFLFFSFLFFLIGFGLTGLLISLKAPQFVVSILMVVMTWTPNLAFVLIYPKLDQETSVWRHIYNMFTVRLRLVPLLLSILVPVFAIAITVLLCSAYLGREILDLIQNISITSALLLFLTDLIRGPLGEEVGWRGYALIELKKRFSTVTSSLILGGIWGLWHLPLWFVTGYTGVELLLYIAFFTVSVISLSLIIGVIYQGKVNNLIYAVLLHQMFNYTLKFLNVDLLLILGASCIVYIVLAIVFGIHEARKPVRQAAYPK